jgi:hypothetical protein
VTPVAPPIAPPTSAIVAAIIGSTERTGTSVTLDQIPLLAVAAQKVVVQLGAQSCIIQVYQKATGLYFDLLVGTKPIVLGALCRDRVWIIRDGYLGFDGDVAFIDTQGVDDPFYTGLVDRYQLVWGH